MGHKGVSKRKPKGSKSSSSGNIKASSIASSVQNIEKGKEISLNSGNTNSYTGVNKKNKKGK
jgi:hypothetical protein